VAERPHDLVPLLDTVLPKKRVTGRLAAATAVNQPHDSRTGAGVARPTPLN